MTSLGFIAPHPPPPLKLSSPPLPSRPLSILINHQFNYSEKCFVYVLRCNKCFKEHVGPTLDEFHQRCNNYKSNDRKFQRLESLACRNIFLVIFQWQATMGFWMMVTTKKEKITRNKHYCYYHYTRITFSSYPYFNLSVIVFTNSYYRSWTLYNLYLEQRYTLLYRNLILYICLSKQNFYKVF